MAASAAASAVVPSSSSGGSSAAAAKKRMETLRSLELREETAEEAEARLAFASAAYDKNLSQLTPYLSKKGVWRVQLNEVGQVANIVKGAAANLLSGQFSMIISGPGEVPRFGSTKHLSTAQLPVVKVLMKDLVTISQIREEALRTPGRGEKVIDEQIDIQLGQLERRFGSLPPSRTELEQQKEQEELEKMPREDDDIMDSSLSFEQMIAVEERKRQKRLRQKEKKRQQQQQQQHEEQQGQQQHPKQKEAQHELLDVHSPSHAHRREGAQSKGATSTK